MKEFKASPSILELPGQTLWGLHMQSSDETQHRDIPALSARLYDRLGTEPETLLPFYVVSRDYQQPTGEFTLFIGSTRPAQGLEKEVLPQGTYAKVELRPLFPFLWGSAIGGAKRRFYTRWLSSSRYKAVNLEYELHTEKSLGKRGTVDLLFAIRK